MPNSQTSHVGKCDSLDKRLAARGQDPEFEQVVRKVEANPDTKLIAKVHNVDMVPHGSYTTITLAK
jgi:hypothetical protein